MSRYSRQTSASGGTPLVHLALLAVQLFYASFGVAAKIALREMPVVGLASLRVTVAAAVFLLVWLVAARERVSVGDLARTAVYAFFGVTLNQLLFMAGLARTSATSAVVLGASIPVFTVGIAVVLGREKATRWKIGGLLLALAGSLTLTASGALPGHSPSSAGSAPLVGNTLILLNSLSFAVYLVISRDLLQRLRPLTVVTLTFLFGALGIDVYMLGGSALGVLDFNPAAFTSHLGSLHRDTVLAVVHIVIFPTVGAYLLNALALRVVPASLVAIYIYIQPVVGALLAAAILGERPTSATAFAAATIFGGIALVNWDVRRRRAT